VILAAAEELKWIPAFVLAILSVGGILRVVIRYDRFFVKDAAEELRGLRLELGDMRQKLGQCIEKHDEAERKIHDLTIEVESLRRQIGEL
jgi:hypothetical protein